MTIANAANLQTLVTDDGGRPHATGWIKRPAAVRAILEQMEREGKPTTFEAAAPRLMQLYAATDEPYFAWDAEKAILGKVLDSWDQGQVGTCFPAGTLVRTADGSHKPIDKLSLLDEVVTAEGNTGRITHLFVRRHVGELCTLVLWGHSHLKATPEHPILTKRGYVPVGELTPDDWVALPKYLPTRTELVVTADHVDARTRRYAQNGGERVYAGVLGRGSVTVKMTPLPDMIYLNADAGLIFGLFLAEGSTDCSKVVWTFNANERDTLVADLVVALQRAWGVEGRIQNRSGNGNSLKVVVYGTHWARLFESLCSTGTGGKKLHSHLASGPPAFLRAILSGWLSGDGYASRRLEKDHGVTVSHSLALDMFAIGTAMGDRPAIQRSEPKISHGVKSRQPRWDVKYHSQGDNFRVESDDCHMWRKVRWVNREEFEGWVYNCEVQGDNSYVAEGIGVHNCVSFGWGRGAQDILLNEIASGEREMWPGFQVATEPIYAGSRVEVGGGGINGDGSIGAWAARFVEQWGILVRKVYTVSGNTYDLTKYSESRSRQWGDSGVPDALEPEARLHPVTAVALVTTADGLWAALGAKKAVPVCSGQGFTTTRDADGFCRLSGSWNHCMLYRGRFVHPRRGKSVIEQNSWGDYLKGPNQVEYVKPDGSVGTFTLPMGCFCVELAVAARALTERDTFAMAGLKGWEVDPVPPGPNPPPIPPVPPMPTDSVAYVFRDMQNGVIVNLNATFPPGSNTANVTAVSVARRSANPSMQEVQAAGMEFATVLNAAMPGAINWMLIMMDVFALYGAWLSKNPAAIIQAAIKLLTDLGVKLPPIPPFGDEPR